MGLLSVQLKNAEAKGLNVPAYRVVSSSQQVEEAFSQYGNMMVISDIMNIEQRKLSFHINNAEVLARSVYRYLRSYLKPTRKMICMQLPDEEVPLLATFRYTINAMGFITVAVECGELKALYECTSGDESHTVNAVYDTGINEYVKQYIVSHVIHQGSHGVYKCSLYDNVVGSQRMPIMYTA